MGIEDKKLAEISERGLNGVLIRRKIDPVRIAVRAVQVTPLNASRERVLEEEPNHFAGGIGTPRKGVGTGRAAT